MKHKIITNIPNNPKEIMDYALSKSYHSEEAYNIIQNNKPHWVISYRNNSYFGDKDYWEFGGSNIRDGDYGAVFICICVDVAIAEEIFKKFNLNVNHIN